MSIDGIRAVDKPPLAAVDFLFGMSIAGGQRVGPRPVGMTAVAQQIASELPLGNVKSYTSVAAMNADVAPAAGTLAYAEGKTYRKTAASGTAGWEVFLDFIPGTQVIYAAITGGTANAPVAITASPVSTVAYKQIIVVGPFSGANSGPMTVTINGVTRTLVTNTGDPIPANYVRDKMSVQVLIDADGKLRMFSYGDAAAIQAAAEAAAASARDARDTALGAVPNVFSVSRTALKTLNTATITAAYLREPGREGQFVWTAGDFSAKIAADTQEGIYIKANAIAATAGAWVRAYSGPANVKWFGAKGDNSNADLPALQAATDLVDAVFIPDGRYRTNGPWLLDDYATLHFESRQAEINSSSTTAIIRPRGHTTSRNFRITIFSGTLRGTGISGPVGLQLRSASMVKVYGTEIVYCTVGVENGGAGSQGAYYNDFFGVDILTVNTGYRNGTLGNEIHVFGGRVNDCLVGTDDDDNSGVLYDGVAIEAFTNYGHRLSNVAACVNVRSFGCRFENPSGNPAYASAIGVRILTGSQDTSIVFPGFTTVDGTSTGVNDIADSGVGTSYFGVEGWNQFGNGTRFKSIRHVQINQGVSSLAAGAGRQDFFAISGVAVGDSVKVTLPSAWPSNLLATGPIIASGGVYMQVWNPTASPISMAAANWIFEVTDRT